MKIPKVYPRTVEKWDFFGYARDMAGRPKKAVGDTRRNVLRIVLTDDERAALDRAARSRTLGTSTWARSALLDLAKRMEKQTPPETDFANG
jgi:hypothetical protein